MLKFVVIKNNEGDFNSFIGPSLTSIQQKVQINMCEVTLTEEEKQRDAGYSYGWNRGIQAYVDAKNFEDDDIFIFVHSDVTIIDPNFAQKVETVFKLKQDVGLVGICGSSKIPELTNWYAVDHDLIKGRWIQFTNAKEIIMTKDNIGYYDDVIVVHKFFLAIRGILIKEGLRFDESFTNDLYNIDMGLQVLERGYKVAVADILMKHQSERENNLGLKVFQNKYIEKGFRFPLTLDQFVKEDAGVEVQL
jgi:hypothetical protein